MMERDDQISANGHIWRLGLYEKASQACLRAMSKDASLTVIYGSEDLAEDSVVVVPSLESFDDKQLLARHRGLLDSYVFMRQLHDPTVHNQNAPSDGVSERLFNLLERERFEDAANAADDVAIQLIDALTFFEEEKVRRFLEEDKPRLANLIDNT